MAKKQIATFLGPQLGLSVAKGFAYAYSGLKQIDDSDVEHLNFTSGDYVFVGDLTMYGPVDVANLALGDISACIVNFNGINLFQVKMDTENEDMTNPMVFPIIIPPRTKVTVNILTDATTADHLTAVSLSGRVYDA